MRQLCDIWRAEARPQSVNAPVESDIPALLLSGNFDPITPPAYADLAHETLTAAYNFVWPNVGHGVLRSDRCAVEIAVAFIEDPLQEPESACLEKNASDRFQLRLHGLATLIQSILLNEWNYQQSCNYP